MASQPASRPASRSVAPPSLSAVQFGFRFAVYLHKCDGNSDHDEVIRVFAEQRPDAAEYLRLKGAAWLDAGELVVLHRSCESVLPPGYDIYPGFDAASPYRCDPVPDPVSPGQRSAVVDAVRSVIFRAGATRFHILSLHPLQTTVTFQYTSVPCAGDPHQVFAWEDEDNGRLGLGRPKFAIGWDFDPFALIGMVRSIKRDEDSSTPAPSA